LEREIDVLGGDTDTSVENERLDAIRREVARITEILGRLTEMVETESYETVDYVGPTKMIDLRSQRQKTNLADRCLEGVRILVVDDDMGICGTLDELLRAAGCNVETANDGIQALRRMEGSEFDIVLSDVAMPYMDGADLYQDIRKRFPKVPVLMMTAFHYDKNHAIKRSRLKGLEGVIFKKPVDPDRLVEVIRDTLKGAAAPARRT
jgi:CheY-like chemotaxis protein